MINITEENDCKVISPQNNLVGAESIDLINVLHQLITEGHCILKVDFLKVNEIDATGIYAIFLFQKNLSPTTEIEFINMERKINTLFSIIRIEQSLEEK